MKPERIQIFQRLQAMLWGLFQIFYFDTPEKAKHFSSFVLDMADNHSQTATCQFDASHTEVTLQVPADDDGDLSAARQFITKVAGIYVDWSTPDEDRSTPDEES